MATRSIYDEKPEFDHEESVTVGWLVRGVKSRVCRPFGEAGCLENREWTPR